MNLQLILAVAFGARSARLRVIWSVMVRQALRTAFPWGTLIINIVGSFLIESCRIFTPSDGRAAGGAGVFTVGICGGFTTFSTFSLMHLC